MIKLSDVLALKDRRPESKYEPAADYGFFGPGSVTWKVWSYPTSMVIGFQRAVTIEQLDPNLNAAVEDSGGVRYRTRTRYKRTIRYFALAAFGDTATATKAADILVKVHSKAIGNDPVTGGHYDANNPASQLWIHMTAWHSILYSYELFGPGPLTEEEELQYWAECARAAELQTIDPADVPRTREAVAEFFASWRPRLAMSEISQDMVNYILHTDFEFPENPPAWLAPLFRFFTEVLATAVVSTYPSYIRKMLGIQQSEATDAAVRMPLKAVLAMLQANKQLYVTVARYLVPTTIPIVAPVILGIPATDPITMTPREAQRRYGYDIPAEAHLDLRARQAERVFGRHEAPSNQGLVESEELFGAMGLAVGPSANRPPAAQASGRSRSA